MPEGDVVAEIERYIVSPGQACAYKVGSSRSWRSRQARRGAARRRLRPRGLPRRRADERRCPALDPRAAGRSLGCGGSAALASRAFSVKVAALWWIQTAAQARPILVPVDFSPHSIAALGWAADLARRLGTRVHVLHVVHDPEDQPGYYHHPEEDPNWSVEATAAKMLDEFLVRCRAEVPALALLQAGLGGDEAAGDGAEHLTQELIVGVPVRRILEVAERIDARLIVMGSRGRTGLSRLLLGSKAQSVVQLAPMPVTIVKAPTESGS